MPTDPSTDPTEGPEVVVTGARIHTSSHTTEAGSPNSYFFSASASMFASQNSFFTGLFSEDYRISQDVPAPVDEGGDIVVEATKAQVDAAQLAYKAAGVNIGIAQVMGIIVAGLVSKNLAIGLAVTDKVIDLNSDELQGAYADIIYRQDADDGVVDGYISEDNSFGGFNYRYNGRHDTQPIGYDNAVFVTDTEMPGLENFQYHSPEPTIVDNSLVIA